MAITEPGAGADPQGPLWRKWAWFAGLWACGVLVTFGVGWLIRWWLQP